MVVGLIVLLVAASLFAAPWLFMLTVGIAFHNWGVPNGTLSFVESIPFALFFLTFVVSRQSSSS